MPVTHHTVSEHAGQRLDNFLTSRLKGVPRSRVYAMVRKGEVRVNGGRARPHTRLATGDVVRVPPHRPLEPRAATLGERFMAELQACVIHEDERLIVLNKPAGVAVHGGSGIVAGVIEALRAARPGASLELTHRLDRGTSGCLVVAKERRTLLAVHEAFRTGQVTKSYHLIVTGRWPRRLRTVQEPLQRYVLPNGERRVRVSADGAAAHTDFEVLKTTANATWLRAFPRTGRTHQIRVHAASRGHAILGDEKYAKRDGGPSANRLMLHASAIALTLDGGRQRYEAMPGDAFTQVWKRYAASRPV